MCFYEQQLFTCGDHKWGRFRAHCNKEYRTGETCGMKLIYEASRVSSKCTMCKKWDVIWRKICMGQERLARWEAEGINPASCEKERMHIHQWKRELRDIELTKQAKMRSV